MYYEDVRLEKGDTVSRLAADYGYKVSDWKKVWDDPRNAALVSSRRAPESLQVGDLLRVLIPWRVVKKAVKVEADGASITVERNGELGERLTWVQTVYRHNQPIGPNPNPFCVDGCTPDDELPFYWTNVEIANDPNLRKQFSDYSSRNPPTVAQGTTKWRAVVSLGIVTGKRVTVNHSLVWGWNMTPANAITAIGPRHASAHEIAGHLHLLRVGRGTGPLDFSGSGWTFRSTP